MEVENDREPEDGLVIALSPAQLALVLVGLVIVFLVIRARRAD